MKLKIRDMDVATGGPLVAILNKDDAQKLDLHVMDRIKIKKGKKTETVVVDIAASRKSVKPNYIGLFEEVIDSLKLKNNQIVDISIARKPLSLEFIRKKMDGKKLNKKEIDQIVWDIVNNKLSSIELTYFVAACYTNAMSTEETIILTKSIAYHGDTLKLDKYPIIDKHSIGGLAGNRTTLILVPIIAAAGFIMPKTSSRSITSPSGTADTMEVLAKVSFSLKEIKKIVLKTNGCMVWGGALNLAPADDKIIMVERPLGIDAESQLLASIMAKKHSVSSTHILIDIPVGNHAKVRNKTEALKLKKDFETIGKRLKKHIKVIITDGTKPIGKGIGPALEARDVLWVLTRDKRRPLDLENKCIKMAAEIFKMLKIKDGEKKTLDLLNSGKAYKKMAEIIKAQNGKSIKPEKIKIGKFIFEVKSKKKGIIRNIKNSIVTKTARVAGAPVNKGAGIYLHKDVGNKVKKGEKLFTVYAESKQKLNYAKDILKEESPFVVK
ncbi:AMP phosphorylase [Candidatus Woesearchaeota archaeon]|nr:AMP phosphorylase [Candidatus Woesearchaeota archaeon]